MRGYNYEGLFQRFLTYIWPNTSQQLLKVEEVKSWKFTTVSTCETLHHNFKWSFRILSVIFFVLICFLLQFLMNFWINGWHSFIQNYFCVIEMEKVTTNYNVELPAIYATDTPVQDMDTEFRLFPTNYSTFEEDQIFITFFVKSHPNHFMRRKVIRETWGGYSTVNNFRVFIIFLVGFTESKKINDAVRSEADCFQDILLMTVSESVQNLTLKTLSTFYWLTKHKQKRSLFYIFTDDNVVVDLHVTTTFLSKKSSYADHKIIYCAFQYEEGAQPIRGFSKRSVTWQQYSSKYYPAFCRGAMVILTYPMIASLYELSAKTNCSVFPLEDVMIYGILRFKLELPAKNIFPVRNGGRVLVFYPWDDTTAVSYKMRRKWQRIVKHDNSNVFKAAIQSFASGNCKPYRSFAKENFL